MDKRRPEPLDVTCPYCGAEPKTLCLGPQDKRGWSQSIRKPHAARLRAARPAQERP